jgi:rhodanese-related sulfurtransferase
MKNAKLTIAILAMAAALAAFGCQNIKDKAAEKAKEKAEQAREKVRQTVVDKSGYEVKNITPAELDKMKSEPDVQLVDVRGPDEYEKGTIKGAINIPKDALSDRLSELNKEKKIIVFCRTGTRSAEAKGILARNGFKKVYNLEGGIEAYKYQIIEDKAAEQAKDKVRQTMVDKSGYDIKNITPAELDKMKSEPDVQLVDVRGPDEYKKGTIEGAINIPVDTFNDRLSELNKEKKIIVFCRTGTRSSAAKGILVRNGFKKVYNLEGGIEAYKKAGSGK